MTKEALKLALEALENIKNDPFKFDLKNGIDNAITAIKEALAQPEQEQFALKHRIAELEGALIGLQAQRTWVGLTDEDLASCSGHEVRWALYWEKLLKEKNNG